jgi:hypothetical protein
MPICEECPVTFPHVRDGFALNIALTTIYRTLETLLKLLSWDGAAQQEICPPLNRS